MEFSINKASEPQESTELREFPKPHENPEPTTASRIRVRWREHAILFWAVLTAMLIAGYIWDWIKIGEDRFAPDYITTYKSQQLSFDYLKNVFIPKAGTAILLFMGYFAVNKLIIPWGKKISFKEETTMIIQRILLVIGTCYILSFLLALGINWATYNAHPYYFSYNGFQLLSLFGYNDQPMADIWVGFEPAMAFVFVISLFAVVRELVIYLIERPDSKRAYRVLILNQLVLFGVIYFSLLSVIAIFNTLNIFDWILFRTLFISFIPSFFLVFMSNTYWLFPLKGKTPFLNYRILGRLLLSTFIFLFPLYILAGAQSSDRPVAPFLFWWALQLFVTTPISWLIYQQRKDKILQLRGAEKELVQSKADLQFLRSQINPHFLYNALNTLYGTALREKAPGSAEGIQKLGDMMRFMLHENHLDFIPMSREIEYLSNYISLQKLRIQASPEIVIEDNIKEQSCTHMIAPMILIPFVENAFKHGISLQEKSWVRISLVCGEKNIRFEVRNSVHARPDQMGNKGLGKDPEKENAGIGLNNVLERLKLVYPGRHQVDIRADNQEFNVLLKIQL